MPKSKTTTESRGDFVSIDPYEGVSLWQNIKYSTLWSTWPSMCFFTGIAIVVTMLHEREDSINLGIAPTMLTVLGTVLGFCISYRTSSAYERYIEGRKLWERIHVSTRSGGRLIWFHLPNTTKAEPIEDQLLAAQDAARALLEKKTMMNLLEAFAVSTKHFLRGESGSHYEDLYHLLLFLPKYQLPNSTPIHRSDIVNPTSGSTPRDTLSRSQSTAHGLSESEIMLSPEEKSSPNGTNDNGIRFRSRASTGMSGMDTSFGSNGKPFGPRNPDKPLLPAHNPPKFDIIDDLFPLLRPIRSIFKFGRRQVKDLLDTEAAERRQRKKKHKKQVYLGENIPMEINLHITNWIATCVRRKTLDAVTAGKLIDINSSLAEALAGLERVLTTPLPFSYAIHLKHTAWLYIALLPFQLVPTLHYLTIPAVFVSSYVFLGFLYCADTIEQPLGYDAADLDMGFFAAAIRKELREIAATPIVDPVDFIFSAYNEPLENDTRSAEQLLDEGVTVDEIQNILSKGHGHDGINRSYTDFRASMSRERHEEKGMMSYLPKMKKERADTLV